MEMESDALSSDSYCGTGDQVLLGRGDDGNGHGDGGRKRKRRFSDEQIKSLECTFEAQAKLETRKKLQLARELGLQPRQVAIWFQNKRARWKSKQLERDYGALRAEYDALLSRYEALEKEKQALSKQSQKMTELLKRPSGAGSGSNAGAPSDEGDAQVEEGAKPILAAVAARSGLTMNMGCSATKEEFVHLEDKPQVVHAVFSSAACSELVIDGPLCFDAGSFSDQSCGSSSDWWEFWPL